MVPNGRWLPTPVLSVALAAAWLLLNNSVAPGHSLLGLALGWAIPLLTRRFWPVRPRIPHPMALLRLVPVVLWDIIVANITVARLVLNPGRRLQPRFMRLPLDLEDGYAITILIGIVTLTPGTIAASLSPDRRQLLIHGLDITDAQSTLARIKTRYEVPLKEAFAC